MTAQKDYSKSNFWLDRAFRGGFEAAVQRLLTAYQYLNTLLEESGQDLRLLSVAAYSEQERCQLQIALDGAQAVYRFICQNPEPITQLPSQEALDEAKTECSILESAFFNALKSRQPLLEQLKTELTMRADEDFLEKVQNDIEATYNEMLTSGYEFVPLNFIAQPRQHSTGEFLQSNILDIVQTDTLLQMILPKYFSLLGKAETTKDWALSYSYHRGGTADQSLDCFPVEVLTLNPELIFDFEIMRALIVGIANKEAASSDGVEEIQTYLLQLAKETYVAHNQTLDLLLWKNEIQRLFHNEDWAIFEIEEWPIIEQLAQEILEGIQQKIYAPGLNLSLEVTQGIKNTRLKRKV